MRSSILAEVLMLSSGRWFEKALNSVGLGLTFLAIIIFYVINLVILSLVLYIAGLMVVGGRKATFGDAFKISILGIFLGSIISGTIGYFIPILGLIAYFVIWLALIKHYFETGWLGALAVAILALIVALVLVIIICVILAIPLVLMEVFRGSLELIAAFMWKT
jgi:hypothetical protein